MIISVSNHADRIRLIAIETMKGAFGNEGALLPFAAKTRCAGANGLADLERFGFTVRKRRGTQRAKVPPPDSGPFSDAEFGKLSPAGQAQLAGSANRRFEFEKRNFAGN